MEQILLRNLGAEVGGGGEDLQAAPDHQKERERIEPLEQPHHERVLVNRPRQHHGSFFFDLGIFSLRLDDFDYRTAHSRTSKGSAATCEGKMPSRQPAGRRRYTTIRKTTNSLGLPSSPLCPARS